MINKDNETQHYDAIVIGSGQAGNPLVFKLSQQGFKVALVEEKNIGGSCINVGCTPTKAMVGSAKVSHQMKNAEDFGINVSYASVDINSVIKRKNDIVRRFRYGLKKSLDKDENITVIKGQGSFIDKETIKINQGHRTFEITGDKIFIDTGSRPNHIPIEGIEDVEYYDSTSMMEIDKLPEHLIIIGTGYIGLEFGQMFRRFGSKVSIIGRNSQILKKEDKDVADKVQEILEEEGVEFYLDADTKSVESFGDDIAVNLEQPSGEKKLTGSTLLLAVGQKPNTEVLNLQEVGIETDDRGYIKANNKLETNIDGIYALGDVNGGPAFTHIAHDDARVIETNLFTDETRTIDNRLVPYTLFTDPELGRIGMTEKEARNNGYDIKVGKIPMKFVGRSIEAGEERGFMKAIVDKDTNKILGCAILGLWGGEIMTMIEIAMMGDMDYRTLKDGIFSHPTLAEGLNNLFGDID